MCINQGEYTHKRKFTITIKTTQDWVDEGTGHISVIYHYIPSTQHID